MAIATSCSGLFGTAMLIWRLRRKIGHMDGKAITLSFLRVSLSAFGMAIAIWFLHPLAIRIMPGASMFRQALQLGFTILLGGATYGVLALLLRIKEVYLMMDLGRRMLGRVLPPTAWLAGNGNATVLPEAAVSDEKNKETER